MTWTIIGTLGGLVLAAFTLQSFWIGRLIEQVSRRIDRLENRADGRFDRIDARFDRLEGDLLRDHGERIARLEAHR